MTESIIDQFVDDMFNRLILLAGAVAVLICLFFIGHDILLWAAGKQVQATLTKTLERQYCGRGCRSPYEAIYSFDVGTRKYNTGWLHTWESPPHTITVKYLPFAPSINKPTINLTSQRLVERVKPPAD